MQNKNDKVIAKTIHLLEELIVFEVIDFEAFLGKLIKLVQQVVLADSLLIYFFDREKNNLSLVASNKHRKQTLQKIKLKAGEGITGWVVNNRKSVAIGEKAYEDKRFRKFTELPEDRFEAFLSVPIIGKDGVIGVINIQNKNKTNFSKSNVEMIQSLVKLIASAFEKVALQEKVDALEQKLAGRKIVDKAKGILMREKQVSESEAYRLLQKEAMKKRKSMREIAEAVILVFG